MSTPVTKITPGQLRPLDPNCCMVLLESPLSKADYVLLAEMLKERSDVTLWVHAIDLDFLKFFPFLKRIQVSDTDLENFDHLKNLPESLEYLGLAATRKKLSLKFLEQFPFLKELSLDGHDRHFESIGVLEELVWLSLRSISLEDLSPLVPLKNLRMLEIKLGSTNNLDLLPKIGKLRYLELGRIRQLTDLSCLGKLSEIRFLFLKTLNKLEALPSFSELSKLRWLYIESLRGLRDLTPISEAPALEQIICIDMPQLNPADFCVFKGHPTLKRAHIGLCSFAKNAQASKLLSLPTTHKMDGERLLQHKTIYSETGEDILR